jgi:hypothetical protein
MFKSRPLVFNPPPGNSKWVTSDCVWEAERGLPTKFILAKHSPDQKHLFHDCLRIPYADIEMVLEQIIVVERLRKPDKSTVARLQQSLPALSAYLSKLSTTEAMGKLGEKLEGQYVVPVYKVDRDGERVTGSCGWNTTLGSMLITNGISRHSMVRFG